jgi:hypothetical protein
MKIGRMISLLLLIMLVITGCGEESSSKKKVNLEKNTAYADRESRSQPNENKVNETQEVLLDHLKITVNSDWTIKKGLDSAALFYKGQSAGGIEGLAYADSLEAVLPNQSIVTEKQKLTQLPFVAYQVNTTSDSVQSKKKIETHVYIFVEPKKAVYDLHFDVNVVNESTILQIAQTAEMIKTE